MYGIINKIKNASVTFKATIWYTLCNALQKLAAFLVIPFLTRMLTKTEYGLYSVFLSWIDIIEVFATMRMYSNGYVAGLVKNSGDQNKYTCSIQFISIITIIVCLFVFYLFSESISNLIQIKKSFIYYMFFSFFATSSVGIWSSTQRVNNRYKLMVLITILYSIVAPVLSIAISYKTSNRLTSIIETRILFQFIIAVPFCLMNLLGNYKSVVWKYCKEALLFNIPLIPYYLSMVLLNNSDRIMIKMLVGEREAAIYSVAYSLSMSSFVVAGALNLSLQPWIFNKLKNNSVKEIAKIITLSTLAVAVLNIGILIVAPELIRLIASNKYEDAVWTMPPIICSLLVIFVYQQLLNIHFYFKENKIIFGASTIAAMLNILLNMLFVRRFGYIAAGYTTLVSYLFIMLLYYLTMKKIAMKKGINYREYFDTPVVFTIILAFGLLTVLVAFLYHYPIVRYSLVITIIVLIFMFRKRLIRFAKELELIKRSGI